MHKGIILLVKGRTKDSMMNKVHKFMKKYEGDVWDWYRIGGRWTGTLAPKDKLAEFDKKMKELIGYKDGDHGISSTKLKENKNTLQKMWQDLGLEGSPVECYDGGYAFSLPDGGGPYDFVPLYTCYDTVLEWSDMKQRIAGCKESIKEYKEKMPDKYDMVEWYKEKIRSMRNQEFCFDTNVYNLIEKNYSVPKKTDLKGWFAVMIDIHN